MSPSVGRIFPSEGAAYKAKYRGVAHPEISEDQLAPGCCCFATTNAEIRPQHHDDAMGWDGNSDEDDEET